MDDRIKLVLSQVLGVDRSAFSDDFSKDSASNWDSLQQMTLVVAFEEEFGVVFNDEQISQMLSFRLIREVLKEAVAG